MNKDIRELAKKIVSTPEFVKGVSNIISPLIKELAESQKELAESQEEINKRLNRLEDKLNLLETKTNQILNFLYGNKNQNSPKSQIQDKYSITEDDLVNIGEFSSIKKGQNDSGKKISDQIYENKKFDNKRSAKFNFELFITNPNEGKLIKNIIPKKIKRHNSSIYINTNLCEDKMRIKPDNKLKLEKKKNSFYTLLTEKAKKLKNPNPKRSISNRIKKK